MADNEIKSYIEKVSELFSDDSHFHNLVDAVENGRTSFTISQKFLKKEFDNDWIDIIEEILPSIDAIVRNPRRFITIEEDIIDISLARQISVESVKHLAQHTQFIASVDNKKGTVTPSKILNTSKEESFEVYENRFLYTLILKLNEFINKRYEVIKKSVISNSQEIKVSLNTKYHINGMDMNVSLVATTDMPYDEEKFRETQTYQSVQRVEKIKQIVQGFLGSAFAKEMRSSALVRPPITRTNVIKKEPNFKKALILWQFIESYSKSGFEAIEVNETTALPQELCDQYSNVLFLNNVILDEYATNFGERVLKEHMPLDIEEEIKKEFEDDDFPPINLELREVRKVYAKHVGDKTYSQKEYRALTSAIDRALNQNRINEEAKSKEAKKKLIEKQKKEDERLKKIAMNERRAELKKKQKELEEDFIKKARERKALLKEEKEKELLKKKAEKERARLALVELLEKQEFEDKVNEFSRLIEEKTERDVLQYISKEDENISKEMKKKVNDTKKEIASLKKQKLEEYSKLLDEEISKLISEEYEKI